MLSSEYKLESKPNTGSVLSKQQSLLSIPSSPLPLSPLSSPLYTMSQYSSINYELLAQQ